MVGFEFNTSALDRSVRILERFRADMPEIAGREIVRQIREFAASGRNPNGSAFKPYTRPYAARRAKMGLPVVPVTLKITGAFLASVKNRDGVIAPDAQHIPIAQGLAKKRKSFQVSPITPPNVERLLLKAYNAAS